MSKTFKVALTSMFVAAFVLSTSVASASAPATNFARSLKLGSTGADVKELQQFLNACSDTAVNLTAGAVGSAGFETMYFGNATKAAVMKYQAKVGVTPLSGNFYTLTRGQASTVGNVCGNTNGGGGGQQTGPVTVMASLDNPTMSYLSATQARATVLKLTFSGTGTVTNISFKKKGSAADSVYQNVYLFDGNMRLTDGGSISGAGVVNFANPAGLFMVNGQKTITVAVDLNGASGDIVGLDLTSFTASGTANNAGVVGNIHSLTNSSGLATVTASATTLPTATSTIDPQNDLVVWQNTMNVSGSNSSGALLSSLALRKIGSINNSDIRNFRLQVDGATVATTMAIEANDIVTLIPSSPVTLNTGSRVVRVLADVVGGATRTFQFQLRYAVDAGLWDASTNPYMGIKICPSGGCNLTFSSLTTGTSTVSGASTSYTFQKASNSPSGDVLYNGNDVTLAKFTLRGSSSENIRIDQLSVGLSSISGATGLATGGNTVADVSLRNGKILIDGNQFGSTSALNGAGTLFNTNYTINAGQTVTVEVKADMYDSNTAGGGAGILPANTQLIAQVQVGTSNGQGSTSGTVFNIPGSNVPGNQLTVKSGTLSASIDGSYASQTTVAPRTMMKIGSFNLNGSSVEDVNVDTLIFNIANANISNLNNVMVKIDGASFGSNRATIGTGTSADVTYSGTYLLAKNASKKVEIYADLLSATTGTVVTKISATGTTTPSGTSVTAGNPSTPSSGVTGQTITVGTGSLTASADASSPLSRIVKGSQSGVNVGAFKFAAVNDTYSVKELVVKFPAAAGTVITGVTLKDDTGAVLAGPRALDGSQSVTFSGLSFQIPANTSTKYVSVFADLGMIGTSNGQTGAEITATLDSRKVAGSDGVEATDNTDIVLTGKNYYAYKAIPMVSNVAIPTTVLAAGTQTIARFSITADGGPITWAKMISKSTVTANPTLAAVTLYDETNTVIPATITSTLASGVYTHTIALTNEEEISTSKTYTLKATVGGTLVTGDSVSTSIQSGVSSYVAPTAYATVAATASSFVWSDKADTAHSLSTSDWNNNVLVKNIPTDSQTMSK